jgi:glycosyltransferase involved in cell wall biosynthesis
LIVTATTSGSDRIAGPDASAQGRSGGLAAPDVGPLHIVGVDPERNFAGGESQVLGLTLELLRLGHRAELICDPSGLLWERARSAGVTCHPLRIRNAIDLSAGMRLRALLSADHADIVHFHTARAHALAPFARGRAGALIVTRRMDYAPNRLTAPWLYGRAVDGIAAISSGVADALVRSGVSRERVTIISSGVDCDHFAPPSEASRQAARAALGLDADTLAIGTVGSLVARKGHRYLIEAMAKLRDRGAFARCFIAGDGPEHGALNALMRSRGLEGEITLMGGVGDVRGLLWALDIFVLPSLMEGLGVALLEAMACALPAIASRTGGIADVIEDGVSGVMVAPGDSDQLRAALRRLAAARELRVALGAVARARAIEHFSMAAMAHRTLELYRTCLARVRERR